MEKRRIKIRIFLWTVLGLLIAWLLYQGIVPFGEVSYTCDFSKPCYNIKKITPRDRVNSENNTQKILGNPVYFSLATPRSFNQANISLKYRNDNDLPIIEAGVLKDKLLWRYDLKPIRNKTIDQLALAWRVVVGEDNTILFQRNLVQADEDIRYYETVDDFLNELPSFDEIAVYNYDLRYNYQMDNYKSNEEQAELINNLRGNYQFYTYIKNEPLNFLFNFFDLNKNKDSDEIEIFVYYNGQIIESYRLDGADMKTGEASVIGSIDLNVADLPEGAYKIEVKASDDIITKEILTSQTKISFVNKIWLADDGRENVALYTDSWTVNGQTTNPLKLQTIKIDDNELGIEETYKLFTVDSFRDVSEIILEKDDVIISGDGLFALAEDQLFNPIIKRVDNLDLNYEGINYVLANYSSPSEIDNWQFANAKFDLSEAYREDGKYSFIISIPGLRTDDLIDDNLVLSQIKVELKGRTLWQKINEILSRW